MSAPNPFAAGPQAAPAQQYQQQAPNALAQAAAPEMAQIRAQNPVVNAFAQQQTPEQAQQFQQQFATTQTAQNGGFPQGAPGQPWTPAQHQQNVPQASVAAPPAPVQQQAPQGFAGGFQPQQAAPAQASSPFAGVTPQGGGGIDPALFGAPSAGGGGLYPKVRDLETRLCLFVVKKRDAEGTAYGDPTKKITNYIVNVAVLDGGPLYASPSKDTPMAQPVLVSETVPYVVQAMTISQVGLQNRLNNDFTRGRIVKIPKDAMAAQLAEAFPGMEPWQALWTWVSQDPARAAMLGSGTYFWGIVEDNSPQADQLVAAFAQNPVSRGLMT